METGDWRVFFLGDGRVAIGALPSKNIIWPGDS